MAEYIFMAKNKPSVSGSLAHFQGDPIEVREDGFPWKPNEDRRAWIAAGRDPAKWPGLFVTVRVLGETVAEARQRLKLKTRPATAIEPEFNAPDAADRVVVEARQAWGIDVSSLPQAYIDDLTADGFIEVPVIEFNKYFVKK